MGETSGMVMSLFGDRVDAGRQLGRSGAGRSRPGRGRRRRPGPATWRGPRRGGSEPGARGTAGRHPRPQTRRPLRSPSLRSGRSESTASVSTTRASWSVSARMPMTSEAIAERERAELERRSRRYREDRPRLDLRGRCVVIVDDGIATGSTATGRLPGRPGAGSRRGIVLAVPVAPEGALVGAARCV